MSKVIINRFDGGVANDRYERTVNEFSIAKNFDIFSQTKRLSPVRTTTADNAVANTLIGNLMIASDGVVYGLGTDPNNPTKTQLYKKADPATNWAAIGNTLTGVQVNYDLFVEYLDNGLTPKIAVGGNGGISFLDKTGVASIQTHTLVFNSLSQGFVHPKDDILYLAYTNSAGATYIASDNNNSWNDTALQLPSSLVVTGLTNYGNYLAIACAPKALFTLPGSDGSPISKVLTTNLGNIKSVVYLWDRQSTLTTLSESIDWGSGALLALNNLNGVLLGVSKVSGLPTGSSFADRFSLVIKEYSGGSPTLVKEILTRKETTTAPSVTINQRVNFIYKDRMYFSADIVGGSTSPAYYGIWSLGRSKETNRWALTLEISSPSASDSSVLAAVPSGDCFFMVYNAIGTLGVSTNNSAFSTIYSDISYYESLVNQGMGASDYGLPKQLKSISVSFLPLNFSSGQVVLKYKFDGGAWTTIATYSAASTTDNDTQTRFERTQDANNSNFSKGSQYEFRIESTGGAEIVEYSYVYEPLVSSNE